MCVCPLFHAMLLTVHSMLTHPIYVSLSFCVFAVSMHVHSGVCTCRQWEILTFFAHIHTMRYACGWAVRVQYDRHAWLASSRSRACDVTARPQLTIHLWRNESLVFRVVARLHGMWRGAARMLYRPTLQIFIMGGTWFRLIRSTCACVSCNFRRAHFDSIGWAWLLSRAQSRGGSENRRGSECLQWRARRSLRLSN